MVTVPFDNLYEELIYSCPIIITLDVPTLFIIFLTAAAAINTNSTIEILPDPLAFSQPDFFTNIPVLLFNPPPRDVSLTNLTVQSTSDRKAVGKGRQRTM